MKKLYVFSLLLLSCLTASAYDFMVDDIYYSIIGDDEIEVTSGDNKYTDDVSIPSTVIYEGITYHVTRIGRNAFAGCSIKSVDIPEGVTKIDEWAFNGCGSLEFLEFPNSLVSIGRWAFYGCSRITSINITRNLTDIAYNVFAALTSLESYTCSPFNSKYCAVGGILYSKDMTTLVAYPQAAPATSFDIPSTVTTVGDYCLHNCDNLTEVNIPETVTKFGMNIFSGCDNIESIYVPDGVSKMGVTVFGQCPKLSYVHLPASLDSIKSSCFYGCNSLEEIIIPRNVRYIGDYTFSECEILKTVTFEEGSCLEEFGDQAFAYCPALESLDMPNTVTTMNKSVFYVCPSLKRVHLSRNITSIGYGCFYKCTSLTELDIPGTCTILGNTAIYECTSLKKLKIGDKDAPAGTTYIEHYALAHCPEIERLELGANIDSLTYGALNYLSNVKLVICWATVPPRANEQGMDVAFSRTPLYVHKASVEAYREARMWNRFQTIVPIEDVGDINGDGAVSIADVSALIDILLGSETDRALFADVNLDGSVSIGDVSALIDRLTGME